MVLLCDEGVGDLKVLCFARSFLFEEKTKTLFYMLAMNFPDLTYTQAFIAYSNGIVFTFRKHKNNGKKALKLVRSYEVPIAISQYVTNIKTNTKPQTNKHAVATFNIYDGCGFTK